MKLKNKLIPILSVLTTSSLIAPLSTSCSTTTSTQESSMIDVLHGYQPGTKKAELAEGLTVDQITDNYVAAIKSNPDLLRQDLAWYEGKALPYRMSNAASTFSEDLYYDYYLQVTEDTSGSYQILGIPKIAKFGLSNISINQEEIVNPSTPSIKEKVYTVSMNVDYEYSYDVVGLAKERTSEYKPYSVLRTYTNKFSATYTNLPFRVTRGSANYSGDAQQSSTPFDQPQTSQTYTGLWNFQLIGWQDRFNWMLEAIPKWSYTVDASQVTVDKLTDLNGNVKTYTYDDSFAATIKDMSTLDAFLSDTDDDDIKPYILNFGSLYLYDVYAPKWNLEQLGYAYTVNGYINEYLNVWPSPISATISGIQLNSTSSEIEAGKYPDTDSASHKLVITTDKELPSKEVAGTSKKYYFLPIQNTQTGEQLLEVEIPVETSVYADGEGGTYTLGVQSYIDINHNIDEESQSELYQKAKAFLEQFEIWIGLQNNLPIYFSTFFYNNYLEFSFPKTETGTSFKFVFTAENTELGTYDEPFELTESVTFPWSEIEHDTIRGY